MPQGDRTGPMGMGPATGWGRGPCGTGMRRGFRRGSGNQGFGFRRFGGMGSSQPVNFSQDDEKKILEAEKVEIEAELKEIKKKLDELKK